MFNQSTESTVQKGIASCRPSVDQVNLLPDISAAVKNCNRIEGG